MKPLIISFFAVILCYSVFVDGNGKAKDGTNKNTSAIFTNASDTLPKADTTVFYAQKSAMPDKYSFMADFEQ